MFNRDRVFLSDYVQFSFMQHLVAARAFYEAGDQADATATAVIACAEDIDAIAANQLVQQYNYAPRIQKIVVARLYAELAASLEDLGALCYAVRQRANEGIFKRYLRSQTADACNAFDYVLNNPTADLDSLLNLPSLQNIQAALPASDYAACATQYTDLAQHIRGAANSYRNVPQSFKPQPVPATLAPGWQDDTNIILDVFETGEAVTPARGGVMAQVYNKLKHRFTVIEDLQNLVSVTDTQGEMTAAYHSVDKAAVDRLMQAIRDGVMAGAELAALVLLLDSRGITI